MSAGDGETVLREFTVAALHSAAGERVIRAQRCVAMLGIVFVVALSIVVRVIGSLHLVARRKRVCVDDGSVVVVVAALPTLDASGQRQEVGEAEARAGAAAAEGAVLVRGEPQVAPRAGPGFACRHAHRCSIRARVAGGAGYNAAGAALHHFAAPWPVCIVISAERLTEFLFAELITPAACLKICNMHHVVATALDVIVFRKFVGTALT